MRGSRDLPGPVLPAIDRCCLQPSPSLQPARGRCGRRALPALPVLDALVVLVVIPVLLVATGCSDRSAAPGSGPGGDAPDPAASGLRVALVTPGPVSDAGWNAAAFAGLRQIREQRGARTAHIEASNPGQFEESFRDFARRGFDLVFGHGFELQDAALVVGAEYPQTAFVITSGLATADNVAGLVFQLEEAAYLAGVLAAGVSSSGITGTVGGMEIPPVRLVFDGFTRGLVAARPDAEVKKIVLGSWEDVASARQATLSLLEQGADVIIHNADAAGMGVFQACRERGALAMGTNSDQAHVAPDVILASAVMDIPAAMDQVVTEVAEGRFTGTVYRFDLASGVVDLVINPRLEHRIPPATRAAIDEARQRILRDEVELEHFEAAAGP